MTSVIQRDQEKLLPPFPNHNMNEGDKLRSDWFPILLPSGS